MIRGSLLAIPIEKSILYVESLYLAASNGQLPELKRVIVAYGNTIAMEENLDLALQKIFGGGPMKDREAPPEAKKPAAGAGAERPAERPSRPSATSGRRRNSSARGTGRPSARS